MIAPLFLQNGTPTGGAPAAQGDQGPQSSRFSDVLQSIHTTDPKHSDPVASPSVEEGAQALEAEGEERSSTVLDEAEVSGDHENPRNSPADKVRENTPNPPQITAPDTDADLASPAAVPAPDRRGEARTPTPVADSLGIKDAGGTGTVSPDDTRPHSVVHNAKTTQVFAAQGVVRPAGLMGAGSAQMGASSTSSVPPLVAVSQADSAGSSIASLGDRSMLEPLARKDLAASFNANAASTQDQMTRQNMRSSADASTGADLFGFKRPPETPRSFVQNATGTVSQPPFAAGKAPVENPAGMQLFDSLDERPSAKERAAFQPWGEPDSRAFPMGDLARADRPAPALATAYTTVNTPAATKGHDYIDAMLPSALSNGEEGVSAKASPDLAPPSSPQAGQVPNLPKPTIMQIVQFAPQPGQQMVEIALSPEELGTVRMSLQSIDGTLTLSFTADRAETLDLLRRYSAELGQEFGALGYDSIDFQFNQGRSEADEPDTFRDQDDDLDLTTAMPDRLGSPNRVTLIAQSGLDLRI